MFKRSSGVLAHVTSLPSPHGVGTMGQTAYDFVDFLADAHQTYWQVLPLGHTGFGDSPYQCFSAAAGKDVYKRQLPALSITNRVRFVKPNYEGLRTVIVCRPCELSYQLKSPK